MLERANNTNYGLASGIITKDIDAAFVFAKGIEAGQVWVNCYAAITAQTPFGGYKESGHGRELYAPTLSIANLYYANICIFIYSGDDGLELYLETKTITIKLPANTN